MRMRVCMCATCGLVIFVGDHQRQLVPVVEGIATRNVCAHSGDLVLFRAGPARGHDSWGPEASEVRRRVVGQHVTRLTPSDGGVGEGHVVELGGRLGQGQALDLR